MAAQGYYGGGGPPQEHHQGGGYPQQGYPPQGYPPPQGGYPNAPPQVRRTPLLNSMPRKLINSYLGIRSAARLRSTAPARLWSTTTTSMSHISLALRIANYGIDAIPTTGEKRRQGQRLWRWVSRSLFSSFVLLLRLRGGLRTLC